MKAKIAEARKADPHAYTWRGQKLEHLEPEELKAALVVMDRLRKSING